MGSDVGGGVGVRLIIKGNVGSRYCRVVGIGWDILEGISGMGRWRSLATRVILARRRCSLERWRTCLAAMQRM